MTSGNTNTQVVLSGAMSSAIPASLMIEPVAGIDEMMKRHNLLLQYRDQVLKHGVDYGVIAGAGDKMVLFKPGAEKLDWFFGLRASYEIVERIEDWDGRDHNGEPFFYYLVLCRLQRGEALVSEHLGSCNSWESKYRWRKAERVCPQCNAEAIRKSKTPEDGWYCWRKVGGCGATFEEYDPAIANQETGRKPNPDVADVTNTVLKMANKRAHIAATLAATLAGEFFTVEANEYESELLDGGPVPAGNEENHAPRTPQPRRTAPGNGSTQGASNAPGNGNAGNAPAIRTPDFKRLAEEAKALGYAVENGAVNQFRLLNAIRAGGFAHDSITRENLPEARSAMFRHYKGDQKGDQNGAAPAPAASTPAVPVPEPQAEGFDPHVEVLPRMDVMQSDEYKAFAQACDDSKLDWRSVEGRAAFESAFSDLTGDLIVVAEMTAPAFAEALERVVAGELTW